MDVSALFLSYFWTEKYLLCLSYSIVFIFLWLSLAEILLLWIRYSYYFNVIILCLKTESYYLWNLCKILSDMLIKVNLFQGLIHLAFFRKLTQNSDHEKYNFRIYKTTNLKWFHTRLERTVTLNILFRRYLHNTFAYVTKNADIFYLHCTLIS